jgi:hypothetical protein
MRKFTDGQTAPVPVGIVGAGRTRGGLGPFLAGFLEAEGFIVTGVSNRSMERSIANAETIAKLLNHPVTSFASPESLCAGGVSALVIASPPEFHLEALQAAASASLPTLCEKPLIVNNQVERGLAIIDHFATNHLPLVENCQWRYVIPAFLQLHGSVPSKREMLVELGLGTPRFGREMIPKYIPHLLSVIQAIDSTGDATVEDVEIDDPRCERTDNTLHFRLHGRAKTVLAKLHLNLCVDPPRPAWLAINGRRIDRHVGEDYSITFSANGAKVAIFDPVRQLVRSFSQLVRNRDGVVLSLEHNLIRQRLVWYGQLLSQLL